MKRRFKIFLIVLMIGAISYLHYTTRTHHEFLHLIHRELYLLPIVLGAYWFGKRAGLILSVIATVLFLPWTVMTTPGQTIYHINTLLQIFMFIAVAYLVGTYRDLKVSYHAATTHQKEKTWISRFPSMATMCCCASTIHRMS
jgi:riboflavin transporter FmnP